MNLVSQTREIEFQDLQESMVNLEREADDLRLKLKSTRRELRTKLASSSKAGSESDAKSGHISLNGDNASQLSTNGMSKKLLSFIAGGEIAK